MPTMLLGSTGDRWVNPRAEVRRVYPDLASTEKALGVLEGADHHVCSNDCLAASFLDAQLSWACSDPIWDMG